MKNFRFTKLILMVLLFLGGLYAVCPAYLRKALVYQTVDIDDYKIFSNRTIIAGNYQPWEQIDGLSSKTLPEKYTEDFEEYKTVAFLVAKNDKIVFEQYWDDYSENSLSNSFSMAKSIVSLMIGIAIDEGYIGSVDDPIGKYLPEFMIGERSKVTIRHLLEMSSGLSWDEAYASPFSMTTKGYYGQNLAELVLTQESLYPPGEKHEFKSGNTQLLGLIIEASTGETMSTYASQKLWKPMGAKNDALWSIDKEKGVEKAFCCFNSNARDFARFGKLLLHDGMVNGKQVVSKSYMDKLDDPALHLTDNNGNKVDYYSWQWWLMEYENHQVVYMRGVNGQYVFVIPDLDLVIVRLGHKRSKEKQGVIPIDIYSYLEAGFELAK